MEAVQAFVSGKDVIIVLPTGYGKSVIYALLPLLEQQIPPTNYFHAISLTSSGSTNSSEVKDTKNTGTP